MTKEEIKSGIIHCANNVCNGCPYDTITHKVAGWAGYVRCMQKLIEDIYNEMKEVE